MYCVRLLFIALAASILASCGGGSSGSSIDSVTPVESDNVTGGQSSTNPGGPEIQNPSVDTDNEVESDPGTNQTADTTVPIGQGANDVTGNLEFGGIVEVIDNTPFRTTVFGGRFYRLSDIEEQFPDTFNVLRQNPNQIVSRDDCSTTVLDFPQTISAGQIIPVTGNTGTIASLTRGNFGVYLDTVETTDPISNLQFDVPGDEFPAFANIQVPNSIGLSGITPTLGSTVTADTVFRWTPVTPDIGTTHLAITIILNVNTESPTNIGCVIVDDGEFSIPQNLRDNNNEEVATLTNIDRIHVITVQNQSAFIQVLRSFRP